MTQAFNSGLGFNYTLCGFSFLLLWTFNSLHRNMIRA